MRLLGLLTLPLAIANVVNLDVRNNDKNHGKNHGKVDKYHGKTLVPSNYTVVTGLFRQDDPGFNGTGYNELTDSFGLKDKSKDRWRKLIKQITELNKNADQYTTYKLVYIARHGEGYHNLPIKYGTNAFNCYWGLQDSDGTNRLRDPELTELGVKQALAVNAGWKEQMKDGVPLPQSLYSSPHIRSAKTLELTWSDILLKNNKVKPEIREMLREYIGMYPADRRSNKTYIAQRFPGFDFEPTFTEHDLLWDAKYTESDGQIAIRMRTALNAIFATDPSTFISITAHGGVMMGLFRAVGHNIFYTQTGGFVPLLVKAVSYPTATFSQIIGGQSSTASICTANPLASFTGVPPAPATWYAGCATTPTTTPTAPTGCLASPTVSP